MITVPPGWTVERDEHGLVLLPAEGPANGIIRYVERLRPIRRAVALVREAGLPRGFAVEKIGTPRRLATREGEPAALVHVEGTLGGRPTMLSFGFVFLDDYYARTIGAATEAVRARAVAAVVEVLVIGDTHFLGPRRRRRFFYAPPPGWQGTGDVFDARWYPLDYPKNAARIFVGAATPWLNGLPEATLAKLTGARPPLPPIADGSRAIITTRGGLVGERLRLQLAPGLETHVALLRDSAMFYAVRLDTPPADAAANLAVLQALLDSIEPLARPQHVPDAELAMASQWAE